MSPELADVLSAIIQRVRGTTGAIPPIAAYDIRECVWLPPMPLLFQRRIGSEDRAITPAVIREILDAALARTSLTDPATGELLRFTPHDFRRVFITDAVLNGLPPHIAQVVAGHRDINVTMGYKAVYPDEAIQAHLGFLARRRSLRPSEEYRAPPTRNGSSSSATSRNARSPSAPAAARSPPPASTNTPASAAPCSGPTPPNATGSSRSATTSSLASSKPNAKAGSAKSKDSRSASPAPTTNLPNSTNVLAASEPSTSECPGSPRTPERSEANELTAALGSAMFAPMSAQQLSAVAALATVVISLVNVGLSSLLVRRQEGQRWRREQLPELAAKLREAAFRWERKIFESDWRLIPEADHPTFAMDEAGEAMDLASRLDVFAAPETISTAQNMLAAIDEIRMHNLRALAESSDENPRSWRLYWAWAEAQHAFLKASRREMGLKPPPIPPGLRRHRERSRLTNSPGDACVAKNHKTESTAGEDSPS